MKIKWYNTIDSTNSAMAAQRQSLRDKEVWAARFQSAGRGQRGNVWNSAPGENLTFSIYLEPAHIPAAEQFCVSEAIALGVCDYLQEKGVAASIKWPNDIYVGDRKICGILIENTIGSRTMKSSIAGIGINLNQTQFPDNLPNPVSLKILTGNNYVIEAELEPLLQCIFKRYDNIGPQTKEDYLKRMYLKDELHIFTVCASGELLPGRIRGRRDDGCLAIETESGGMRYFAFKEISY